MLHEMSPAVDAFVKKWAASGAAERNLPEKPFQRRHL
jgi:hypothetical protein